MTRQYATPEDLAAFLADEYRDATSPALLDPAEFAHAFAEDVDPSSLSIVSAKDRATTRALARDPNAAELSQFDVQVRLPRKLSHMDYNLLRGLGWDVRFDRKSVRMPYPAHLWVVAYVSAPAALAG